MSGCTKVASWNAYLCYNEKIAQIMFESLDDDKEDRMFSPINILGQGNNFNNTLNTFMDHCWDGHYTCQKRLSRFPAMLETQKSYEIYFTGTQPGKTRYMLEGADDGDWLIVKIDFSKSILFYVYADGVKVESNRYDGTAKKIPQLTKSKCGENRFEQITYTYEFYLTKGCVVQIEAQDHLIGLVRLQMSLDQFFEEDFVSKLAFALGITTDRIRVVGTQVGSVIVNFYITSSESTSTTRTAQLRSLNDQLASKYANGQLNLGYPILDLVTSIVSSSGSTITTGTGTYTKKEIHVSVYILLALSAVAVVIGFIFGLVKAIKTSRAYKKLANSDPVEYIKGEVNESGPEGTIEFRNEVRS
uniref:Uncharacterized protein n=1 Tax=Euplotes harpa TaxID=151035 RepID=A0A7S3JIH3_9SPIT|mmetsp:Transcript_42261/g.49155  ORF Transcript_42261/g.49155 Transcript_42261/m.49155 type:complete len:359 (+) Transcript_42261:1489-2565(+)